MLSQESSVIELGCGIAGIVGLALAPRISNYVLTDQPYVAKLVEQNIVENSQTFQRSATTTAGKKHSSSKSKGGRSSSTKSPAVTTTTAACSNLSFTPLDWETDEVTSALTGSSDVKSFDAVVACDCIYNEALVDPFVSTCADICRLRADDENNEGRKKPCICVVAQNLRDPAVFETWVTRFTESFHAWRVPDSLLPEQLRAKAGFVVHIGVLRGTLDETELLRGTSSR